MKLIVKAMYALFVVGMIQISTAYAQKVAINGTEHEANAPCEGNNFSIMATDGSYMVVVLNSPDAGSADVNDDVMTKGCGDCPFIQVMSLTEGKEYYSKSGTMTHEGNNIKFNVKVYAPDAPDALIDASGDVTCQ